MAETWLLLPLLTSLAADRAARRLCLQDVDARPQQLREDIGSVAGQFAELTRTVEEMAKQLRALRERADSQQALADSQETARKHSKSGLISQREN